MTIQLSTAFPQYSDFDPAVPVWCITPGEGRVFHRFFDTSPVSPSGRFVALTRMPYENRLPLLGDPAEVVLVDLQAGTERVVAETRGWDTQLGAQAQWGADDSQLFFNDLEAGEWRPYGVRVNPATGERTDLAGTVYMVSPDGQWAASPCLMRTARTQAGYGVVVPDGRIPRNRGASTDDGLTLTDTKTGKRRLLISFGEIVEMLGAPLDSSDYARGAFYGAHVKWNPQGDRLMFVVRWLPDQGLMKPNLITVRHDATEVHLAIPASEWGKGGHHPNWCPDGEHVMMNLRLGGQAMRLVRARYDGAGLEAMTHAVVGSGHPSLHPDGRHVVTDAYPGEPVAFGDGTVPIRLIDLAAGAETAIARIRTVPPFTGPEGELRVDPHPAWDRAFQRIAFNACPDGTRRVYIADLTPLLG